MSAVAEILKAYRKGHGLTQVALAKRLGLSKAAIAFWETDRGEPSEANREIIERELGLKLPGGLLGSGERGPVLRIAGPGPAADEELPVVAPPTQGGGEGWVRVDHLVGGRRAGPRLTWVKGTGRVSMNRTLRELAAFRPGTKLICEINTSEALIVMRADDDGRMVVRDVKTGGCAVAGRSLACYHGITLPVTCTVESVEPGRLTFRYEG